MKHSESNSFSTIFAAGLFALFPLADAWSIEIPKLVDPQFHVVFEQGENGCDFGTKCTDSHGSWDRSTQEFYMDNSADELKTKLLWLQIKLYEFDPHDESTPTISGTGIGSHTWELIQKDLNAYNATLTYLFKISPQPAWETIKLPGSFLVDANGYDKDNIKSMEMMSLCVPEPSTWAMLIAGLGAVSLAFRRKHEGCGQLNA